VVFSLRYKFRRDRRPQKSNSQNASQSWFGNKFFVKRVVRALASKFKLDEIKKSAADSVARTTNPCFFRRGWVCICSQRLPAIHPRRSVGFIYRVLLSSSNFYHLNHRACLGFGKNLFSSSKGLPLYPKQRNLRKVWSCWVDVHFPNVSQTASGNARIFRFAVRTWPLRAGLCMQWEFGPLRPLRKSQKSYSARF